MFWEAAISGRGGGLCGLSSTIRHTIITRTFFCFCNYSSPKASNVTRKITPALLAKHFKECISLFAMVLSNKAHDTGYTPEMFWGVPFGHSYTQKSRELHKTILGEFN